MKRCCLEAMLFFALYCNYQPAWCQQNAGGDPGAGSGFGDLVLRQSYPNRLPASGRTMGNISPYRRDMLQRIRAKWHMPVQPPFRPPIVAITIAHDGHTVDREVLQSSGDKGLDKQAINAIEHTQFAALPSWYHGEQLQFKIDFAKVTSVRSAVVPATSKPPDTASSTGTADPKR